MSTDVTECHPPDCNWEKRQKHASFFQNQIGFVQQAALAEIAALMILLTVIFMLSKLSVITPNQDIIVVIFGIISLFIVSILIAKGFIRSAYRIRDTYLSEHDILFPGSTPYSLESYLLNFADNRPAPARKSAEQPPSEQDEGETGKSD